MRYSKLFGKTLREAPKVVETRSQQWLLRAGLIKASSPGSFILLPLGYRVLRKMNRIVAEEFAARGVQFLLTPPPHPPPAKERAPHAEPKHTLKACRSQMRQQYFLASQHEDDLSALAGFLPMTYKELPILLGHCQWKYREEGRGSATLLSARQFLMQAVYSFDVDEAGVKSSAALLEETCQAVFRHMGIEVIALTTDPGSPGRPASTDFVALSEAGDEEIVLCDGCEYRASLERAQSLFPAFEQEENPRAIETVFGPGIVATAELAAFVGIPIEKTTKTLLFQADDQVVAVCVRGEYDVSETKLAELLGCAQLKLAPAQVVKELTGADVGYAGPIGLPEEVETIWDLTTEGRVNFEVGANRTDYHCINVNFGRDLPKPETFVDVRRIKEGETCIRCRQGRLRVRKAIRLGHVSKLGTMYSKELRATFTTREGKSEPMLLSCCGMDMMRLFAVIVEQHSNTKGIAWPKSLAPFAGHLISLPGGEKRAKDIYERFVQAGIDVLWDDRDAPAGAKFGDADLMGIPIRLVVSTRTGENVEWKERQGESPELISVEEAIRRLASVDRGSSEDRHAEE